MAHIRWLRILTNFFSRFITENTISHHNQTSATKSFSDPSLKFLVQNYCERKIAIFDRCWYIRAIIARLGKKLKEKIEKCLVK